MRRLPRHALVTAKHVLVGGLLACAAQVAMYLFVEYWAVTRYLLLAMTLVVALAIILRVAEAIRPALVRRLRRYLKRALRCRQSHVRRRLTDVGDSLTHLQDLLTDVEKSVTAPYMRSWFQGHGDLTVRFAHPKTRFVRHWAVLALLLLILAIAIFLGSAALTTKVLSFNLKKQLQFGSLVFGIAVGLCLYFKYRYQLPTVSGKIMYFLAVVLGPAATLVALEEVFM